MPAETGGLPWWWVLVAVAVIGAAALAWTLLRRERPAADEWVEQAEAEPAPPPSPAPSPVVATPVAPAPVAPRPQPQPQTPQPQPSQPAAAPVPPAPKPPGGLVTTSLRPNLTLELQPVKAGVDSLRMTLDFVLHVANAGQAPALAVAIETWLFGAGSDPQAELDQLLAQPVGQPQMPPFDLQPSAAADLSGQAMAPREGLAIISASERRMVVPTLAVRAHYLDRRGQAGVVTGAFLMGIERDGQDRLAPLALDRGARSYDRLAARRFG